MQRQSRFSGAPAARRLRLLAVASCAALIVACTGPAAVAPAARHAAPAERAEQLARAGDHAGSAAAYEEAGAAGDTASRAAALTAAAREWLRVPAVDEAVRVDAALAALPEIDPRSTAGIARALTGADVALAAHQPERALARLRALGDPPPAGSEAEVLLARGRAQLALGRGLDGVRTLVAREQYVPAPQLADEQRRLWVALRDAAAHGAVLTAPRGTDALLTGWLELARIATQSQRNPRAARAQLADWVKRYPSHPANGPLIATMQTDSSPPTELPARIALLLPLSGRLSDAGETLRDGLLAAYYQQDAASRPDIRIYDAATDADAVYRRALADGAVFVVGPLGKENVQAVARIADGSVPVLALNFLPDGDRAPPRFYQFALAPEDEARQVAERLLAEGRRAGVALVPSGEWGTRVLAAFNAALVAGGGTVVASRTFTPGTTDFSDILVGLLGFDESQRRYHAVTAIVGPLQFTPRRRDDLQFAFVAGQPLEGRQMRSALKFQYAGDLATYAISSVYEPNPIGNQDMDGVAFPDMPWLIADDPATGDLRTSVQQLWPNSARPRSRLFAMGFDSWRLVAALKDPRGFGSEPLQGLSGRLSVDAAGRVRRSLDWAVITTDGVARPLAPPAGTP
jgi:outer membrane PBP1 activator LpoA protein